MEIQDQAENQPEPNNIENNEIKKDEENENYENNNTNNNEEEELDDEDNELMYIYEWVDSIQLSRPKKNIARDFSDGLLLAEVIKAYLPRYVELHNYPSCTSMENKRTNWNVLNQKVLRKIGCKLTKQEIEDIISFQPMAIENVLKKVYFALQEKCNVNMGNNMQNNSNFGQSNNNIEFVLRKKLAEKENIIKQLKDIVEVLEMKLKNSEEMERNLEGKISKLNEIIGSKGNEA